MVAPVPAQISTLRPRPCTPPRRRFPAHSRPSDAPSGASKGAHSAKGCESTDTSTLTTFRINTCKSVSKQSTLTTFRMNTYKKMGGGGTGASPNLGRPASNFSLCDTVGTWFSHAPTLLATRTCGLFHVSLPSFSGPRPLFSIVCSLFLQNTGGGVSRMQLSRLRTRRRQ
jgi:hypothetical protein